MENGGGGIFKCNMKNKSQKSNAKGVKVHFSEVYELKRGDLQLIANYSGCGYGHVYAWWHKTYKKEENIDRVEEMKAAVMLLIAEREKLETIEQQLREWLATRKIMRE